MEEKWCEHIGYRKGWTVTSDHPIESVKSWSSQDVDKSWKFCPLCAAPRPEPRRKKLAKVLCDADHNWNKKQGASQYNPLTELYSDFLAKAAIEAVEAVVDEIKFITPGEQRDLKQKLREELL